MLKRFIFVLCNFIKYRFFYFETKFFSDFFKETKVTTLSKKIPFNKKIIIYGFGPYGEEAFVNFFFTNRIMGIYDINYDSMEHYIENPNNINYQHFDYVIVTVMNSNARNAVSCFLNDKNVSNDKIIYIDYI